MEDSLEQTTGEPDKVYVRFETKLDLQVPASQFSVPDNLARYGLSEIVNHFQQGRPPKPYDFLVKGQFLRTDLKRYLASQGLLREPVVVLEVVEAFPQPSSATGDPHPDWISSVDSCVNKFIVTGCYDGVLRFFPQSGDQVSLSGSRVCKGHGSAVTAVACFGGWPGFVSTSKDRTARLWQCEQDGSVSNVAICKGHRESVQAVATQGAKFVTGGWDKTVRVWGLDELLSAEEPTAKRQKKEIETPLDVFEGHVQCVSALCWPHPAAIYSASWDMSIRMWDAHKGVTVNTWLGNKAISSLSFSHPGNLLSTAHNDKTVRIWDPRLKEAEVMKLRLRSHQGWVTGVAFSPHDSHVLASSSHDHTVKLWDLRSQLPLHTLTSHTDKVLCVGWYGSEAVLSGGSDSKLAAHTLRAQR